MISLRPYQTKAIDAVRTAESNGIRRQMVVMPTGGGKTIVFASLIAERNARALVLAHREELIDQAANKIRMVMPENTTVGIMQASRNDWWSQIVVASVPTIRGGKRLELVASRPFDMIITDEAHHSFAKSYRSIYDRLGVGEPWGPLLVGVTATPDRGDGKPLDDLFDAIVYEVGIEELIRDGYLCDIRAKLVQLEVDLDSVKRTGGDYSESALQDAMVAADQPWHTAKAVLDHATDRKSIVFVAGVELAHETAAELLALGIETEVVHGDMPSLDRRAVISRLKSGATRCVVNCMVLTEGFDEPTVDCVVIARPTASRSLYQQMAGRGLRISPGKQDCLIIDVVGVTQRHDLQTVSSLAGRKIGDSQTFLGVLEREQEEEEESGAIDGRLVAIDVDVFHRSRFKWAQLPTPTPVWSISTGKAERIYISPTKDGTFSVIRYSWESNNLEVIAKHLDQGYAQGVAEDHARKSNMSGLLDREAAWRSIPSITDGQLAQAVKLNLLDGFINLGGNRFVKDGRMLTRGEMSEMMDQAFALKTYQRISRRIEGAMAA